MDVPTSKKDPGAAQKRVAGVPPGRTDPEKRVGVALMVMTFLIPMRFVLLTVLED